MMWFALLGALLIGLGLGIALGVLARGGLPAIKSQAPAAKDPRRKPRFPN